MEGVMVLINTMLALLMGLVLQNVPIDAAIAQHTGPPAAGSIQSAETVCADRQAMVARLLSEYGERPVAVGILSNGNLMEVLASSSGSWTVLVTWPSRLSCVVTFGTDWKMETQALEPSRGHAPVNLQRLRDGAPVAGSSVHRR